MTFQYSAEWNVPERDGVGLDEEHRAPTARAGLARWNRRRAGLFIGEHVSLGRQPDRKLRPDGHHLFDIGEVAEEMICPMGLELFDRKLPSGHCDGLRANGAGARNVVGGVANHENARGSEGDARVLMGAFEGEWTERIAVVMIISECAECEVVMNAESAEFGVGSFAEIAGEKSQREAGVV